jgi:hypothetical protein
MLTVYMLIRSFYGYVYQRIPFPSQFLAYHEGLKAHYGALGTPGLADQEFDLYLRGQYVEAGDRNSVHNVNRGEYLHQGNRALILSLCALVGCAVPHVLAVRQSKPEPQQIQLVNGGTQMPNRHDRPAVPVAPVAVPPKPVPPANIDLRTGTTVPKPLADSLRGRP